MYPRKLPVCFLLLLSLCAACAPLPAAAPTATAHPIRPTASPVLTHAAATLDTHPAAPPGQPQQTFLQVERLRGIEARQTLASSLVTQAEIDRLARAAFLAAWPVPFLERDVRLLRRFGLAEPDLNLEVLVAALGLGAAVVSEAPDGGLAISTDLRGADEDLAQVACAYDRWLLVGSMPGLASGLQADTCQANVDRCLASRALVQGDAALLTEQWQRTFGSSSRPLEGTPTGCGALLSAIEPGASGLMRVLAFPVRQGVGFARGLFLKGGWAGVDQAYADPPISTEQILHPERYPSDTPRPPELPDLAPSLGPGWTTEDTDVLGEWRMRLVLESFLGSDEAALAASGWDGDQYALLSSPEDARTALVLLTRWDTVRDAHEFSGAFRTYGENRFGPSRRVGTSLTWTTPDGVVVLDVGNDQTLWVEAPDAASAAALRKASGFPLH
jgi:hypothetical protein